MIATEFGTSQIMIYRSTEEEIPSDTSIRSPNNFICFIIWQLPTIVGNKNWSTKKKQQLNNGSINITNWI